MNVAIPAPWQTEIELACSLARQAGTAIMDHYTKHVDIEYKDAAQTDPVTDADKHANSIIVDGLREAFPDDGILAEESVDTPERFNKSRLWIVDPLDGTREFIDHNGQFVVMIGLAVSGTAAIGVVYQPTEDLLWWGAGDVAVEVSSSGSRAIKVSGHTDFKDVAMVVSRSHRSQNINDIAQTLGITRQMPLGSVGLKIARIVTATAGVYMSFTDRTKEWDACAPEAIVKAAGGTMTDVRGNPLRYNKQNPNTPFGMLATNGHLHPACVDVLRPLVQRYHRD